MVCFVNQQEWNMGQRTSNTTAVTFEDVIVPNEVSLTTATDNCNISYSRMFWQLLEKVLKLP